MYESVHRNAINASLRDTRFRPVSPEELANIDVNISMLSPMNDIPGYADFEVGKHGIVMQKGHRRAVFLPEVATELKWTREDTLKHLSEKAGLPSDAWRQGARFQVFESVVLSL
jgi:AmmeMemoRadiSam system protein A